MWPFCEAQKTVLLGREHRKLPRLDNARARFPNAQLAIDLVEEDAPVRGQFQFHWLRHAVGQRLGLEPVFWWSLGRRQ